MKLSEFDFRVWNNNSKTYEAGSIIESLGFITSVFNQLTYEKPTIDYEIELFTGLYDNNNNKIYEGDIISIYVSGDFINYTVVYNKDKASFVAIVDDYEEDFTCYSDIEVIGNIHENAELLRI
ncbi:YopX family protein [Campylobacter coli]